MTILHLVNTSTTHFHGWLQCNVDVLPLHPRGTHSDQFCYILGNRSGLDTWNLDVYCGLGPGESKTLDLTTAEPMDYNPHAGMFPQNAGMWGGIPVSVAGVQLEFVGAEENGAGFDGHWAGRITPMLHVDVFIHWMPDDPAWCTGEIIPVASNPSVPDIVATLPFLWLRFGDADVMVPGLETNAMLAMRDDWFADGQGRPLPFVLCWKRHGGNEAMCRAVADQQVTCNGLKNLHGIEGNPHLPVGFDARKWTREMLPTVIARQHDWQAGPLDQAMVSGASGAQAGQSFICGPAMADAAAVGPIYIAGLDASWPMFHLEANGDQIDWKAHPGLRMFYGKVNTYISTDMLGKTAWPDMAASHGYAGPEDEHWFCFGEFGANRLRGTPGTQWILRAHAIHCLFRYVTEPPGNWLTASRGIGWASFLVAELYRGLADRELAEAVAQRWRDVFLQLIAPMGEDGSWWTWIPWPRNASIGGTQGAAARAIPWQACVLALGLDWAGRAIGDGGMRDFAKNIALEILGRTYVKQGDRWTSRSVITQDGSDPGPHFGAYDFFGTPMVVACVLRHDSEHAQAREIWAQLVRESTTWEASAWLCPSIEVTP